MQEEGECDLYGAREIIRLIDKVFVTEIANQILESRHIDNNKMVVDHVKGDVKVTYRAK